MAKKYIQFGSGWLKQGKNGEYVSAVSGGERAKTKLFIQLENGEMREVNSFAMFFNSSKVKDTQPDVQFTTVIE